MTMEMHGGSVALGLGVSELLLMDGDVGRSKDAALPSIGRTIAVGHRSILRWVCWHGGCWAVHARGCRALVVWGMVWG